MKHNCAKTLLKMQQDQRDTKADRHLLITNLQAFAVGEITFASVDIFRAVNVGKLSLLGH